MPRKDQRRHPRRNVRDLSGTLLRVHTAQVIDIGLLGLAVRTSSPLSVGRAYRVRLDEPPQALELSGTVRWCHFAQVRKGEADDVVAVYDSGIALDGVLTALGLELEAIARRRGDVDTERRTATRFAPREPLTARLEAVYDFGVRELSLSGMLIETPLSPRMDAVFDLVLDLGGEPFPAQGRVVDIAEIDASDGTLRFRVGVEFVAPEPEQRRRLEAFTREGRREPGRRRPAAAQE